MTKLPVPTEPSINSLGRASDPACHEWQHGRHIDTMPKQPQGLVRDMMVPICGQLGEAAAKAGEPPNVSDLEKSDWRAAYMRGYERYQRRERARKAREKAVGMIR